MNTPELQKAIRDTYAACRSGGSMITRNTWIHDALWVAAFIVGVLWLTSLLDPMSGLMEFLR